jgi:YHS domain-containing protein
MKNLVKSILVVSSILVSTFTFAQDKKAYNIDDSKIALQGYSPVSYLDLGIAQVGLKEYKASYNGLNYYFTSQDQKKTFEANPTKYLPQYGGFCAFGVSVGAKFRVDPNKFLVKDGKYFLFLYDLEVDAQQLWLAGKHKDLLSTADTNWNKLSMQP